MHAPHPVDRGDWKGWRHLGIDVEVCDGQRIVAIGDGLVTSIEPGDTRDSRGGTLLVTHDEPGDPGAVRFFLYAHVVNLQVTSGQRVQQGQLLGDPWSPADGYQWRPHVHLEYLDPVMSVDKADPLPLLHGCPSAPRNAAAFTLPVSC